MEFDVSWLLFGLPIAFSLGWLASRVDIAQLRIENRQAPKAYFRGLNFLLNEQQDQAIDAFIEAVQNDPDTSELHFALGNLFRRRGEYDRAVRVHEHLLSRGDLAGKERDRAQHALALDYLKAGLLDRAEQSLRKLDGTRYAEEARLALLSIYERSRDWPQATQIASQLSATGQANFSVRQAHYLCEQADQAAKSGKQQEALAYLKQAAQSAPSSSRVWIDLAKHHFAQQESALAFECLDTLARTTPQALPLAAQLAVEIARQSPELQPKVLALLEAHYTAAPSLDVMQALAALAPNGLADRERFSAHLSREPSLVAAAGWLAKEQLGTPAESVQLHRAIDQAVLPLMRYRCAACGFEATQHFWHCPGCQAWDSYPARRIEEL
jgi:lipopolysaccharide assembly protein B